MADTRVLSVRVGCFARLSKLQPKAALVESDGLVLLVVKVGIVSLDQPQRMAMVKSVQ